MISVPVPVLTRRVFVADLGRAGIAVAVLGLAGCAAPVTAPPSRASANAGGGRGPGSPSGSASEGAGGPSGGSAAASGGPNGPIGNGGGSSAAGRADWHRVNLGGVSAYVLARAGEAAVVDTGVAGSEGAIADALAAAGVGWGDVGHVVVTHKHRDHAGSLDAVMAAAPGATAYAGADEIPAIDSARPLQAVGDGDRVLGLRIVATPGHTPGHVSVLDEAAGVLVAGDALRTADGSPGPPNASFTEDMDLALRSIARLGALSFETLLVGHGEPIESGASAQVRGMAGGG
jgi:glyoxylase-like metal-dependent hydrolase (beta-lactamase superfamily II)